MINLVNSYYALGRRAAALKLSEETLALAKAKLMPDHPFTLLSMNNLAFCYAGLGRHAEALKLREETLALRKSKLAPDHPDTLESMNSLADSYSDLHRHAEALKLREETLALRKAKLGPNHPETLTSMNNLADSYYALGRHAEALKIRKETLTLRKAKLGPDHPSTLWSMGKLASSLVQVDCGTEAVPIINECLKRAERQVVDPGLIPLLMESRLGHFAKAKDAAGCRQTAEMWDQLKRTDSESLYNAACFRAITAAVFRANAKSEKGTKDAAAEADRAVAWLKQAVAAGYKDVANMKKDKDLDELRGREDFKKLMAKLEADNPKGKE